VNNSINNHKLHKDCISHRNQFTMFINNVIFLLLQRIDSLMELQKIICQVFRLNDQHYTPQYVCCHQDCIHRILTRTWLRYVRVFAVVNPSVCLSSVTLVHPNQGVESVSNISSPLCTLTILWPPCKNLRRSSQENPSIGGAISHKRYKINV